MMNNPKKFIDEVQAFQGENIDEWKLQQLAPILAMDFFNYETMKGKSTAAAHLTNWVVNIVKYNSIYKIVKPLKDKAQEA